MAEKFNRVIQQDRFNNEKLIFSYYYFNALEDVKMNMMDVHLASNARLFFKCSKWLNKNMTKYHEEERRIENDIERVMEKFNG